jgi:hypothetical protein
MTPNKYQQMTAITRAAAVEMAFEALSEELFFFTTVGRRRFSFF